MPARRRPQRPSRTARAQRSRAFRVPAWLGVPAWRREQLRTNLWVVPGAMVAAAVPLFLLTHLLDQAVYDGRFSLPGWLNSAGSADAGRQLLIAIAAAVITVAGVVFSVVIVALTLASQQFGPRMLRTFLRDRGTQVSLGMFVATFVFSTLALASISSGSGRDFVPHVSITAALALLLVDSMVLVYFIHHVAVSIQMNEVIAGIGSDLVRGIDNEIRREKTAALPDYLLEQGRFHPELLDSAEVAATRTGYLGAISRETLLRLASDTDAVIVLLHRPGHFVVAGRPLARVSPPQAAVTVARALDRAHITGRHRTLTQDMVFAVDQLVEIALRALSPAVNDTFTAIACIDWLTAGLCHLSPHTFPERVFRDGRGAVRLVEPGLSYRRVVDGAFDKVRQAGRGMPAVAIRQLDSIGRIMESTVAEVQREVLLEQAEMILRAGEEAIPEPNDRDDVRRRYDAVCAIAERMSGTAANVTVEEA
jgi:uncharacterized membrane protein